MAYNGLRVCEGLKNVVYSDRKQQLPFAKQVLAVRASSLFRSLKFNKKKMSIHVYPLNDLKEHTFESTCDCCPSVTIQNGEMIICHNSFDGREIIEKINEILKNETEKNRKHKSRN